MDTQGIKYTGSKREILPALLELIKPLNVKTILDGFSGTTRVSQALKQAGYTVYANDIADWSKVFGGCYLLNRKPANYYLPIIEHLNNLPGKWLVFRKLWRRAKRRFGHTERRQKKNLAITQY